MPHRLHNLVVPLAELHSTKMAPAVEALIHHACTDAALAAALVARGVSPGVANMVVQNWRALGLLVPSDVYAPAHILESTITGTAGPIAQHIATVDPTLARSIAIAPGYERAIAGVPGITGLAPGIAAPGITGYAPGMERIMGISPFVSPMVSPWAGVMGIQQPGIRGLMDPV